VRGCGWVGGCCLVGVGGCQCVQGVPACSVCVCVCVCVCVFGVGVCVCLLVIASFRVNALPLVTNHSPPPPPPTPPLPPMHVVGDSAAAHPLDTGGRGRGGVGGAESGRIGRRGGVRGSTGDLVGVGRAWGHGGVGDVALCNAARSRGHVHERRCRPSQQSIVYVAMLHRDQDHSVARGRGP